MLKEGRSLSTAVTPLSPEGPGDDGYSFQDMGSVGGPGGNPAGGGNRGAAKQDASSGRGGGGGGRSSGGGGELGPEINGVISSWKVDKGYGFINGCMVNGKCQDVFIHASMIADGSLGRCCGRGGDRGSKGRGARITQDLAGKKVRFRVDLSRADSRGPRAGPGAVLVPPAGE